jgi:hypothetical protein
MLPDDDADIRLLLRREPPEAFREPALLPVGGRLRVSAGRCGAPDGRGLAESRAREIGPDASVVWI